MKRYRHIKTGDIANIDDTDYYARIAADNVLVPTKYIRDSNDWQEIIEKDYEILSFKAGCRPYNILEGENLEDTLKRGCLHESYKIHSVKRLSDGEVFTIGDEVYINSFGKLIIKSFEINNNNKVLFIATDRKGRYKLQDCCVSKQPLFKTEDGVGIFEGDKYYFVNTDNHNGYKSFSIIEKTYANDNDVLLDNLKPGKFINFSTKEAAKEYILMNKPCLSIKEIQPLFGGAYLDNSIDTLDRLTNKLKQLVKSKLKT